MAHDAFKIPLRPNPSTLPNVFPTILHELEAGPLPKQTQKLFSFLSFFFLSREPGPYLINMRGCPRRTDLAEWFSAFADPFKLRTDQTLGAEFGRSLFFFPSGSLKQSNQSQTESKTIGVIGSVLSVYQTHAGMCCVEFYLQPVRRQDRWRSPVSGSRRSSGRLPHKSDSTCTDIRW